MLWVVFFVGTFGMNFQMTSALMAQQEFGMGPQEYGILGTFMAVGSLAGALLAARRRIAPRGRFVVIMACVFGAVEIVAGLMPTYASYAAVLPVLGLRRPADPDRLQRLDPAGGRPAAARSGDGALHDGADGWHAARRRRCSAGSGGLRAALDPDRRGFPGRVGVLVSAAALSVAASAQAGTRN